MLLWSIAESLNTKGRAYELNTRHNTLIHAEEQDGVAGNPPSNDDTIPHPKRPSIAKFEGRNHPDEYWLFAKKQ